MRNVYLVGGAAMAAVIAGAFFFLYNGETFSHTPQSAASENQPAAVIVPFTELARGTQSDVAIRANYLITSAEDLEKLWKLVDAEGEPPTVDFASTAVAAIFAGQKATGGYAVEVAKITDAQKRVVTVALSSPGNACVPTQAVTAPYQIIEVSKTALPFTHEDQATTTDCSD